MNPSITLKFKSLFERQRSEIETRLKMSNIDLEVDTSSLAGDEADLCAKESQRALAIRLRKRESFYLEKIYVALKKIAEKSFGICDGCGDPIGLKRLQARPTSTLCIACKEEQEKKESSFMNKPRIGSVRRIV